MRTTLGFVIVAAIASAACSSTTTGSSSGTSGGTSGSSGSTPVSVADCSTRCQKKATSCGEPAADAMNSCSSLCASTTESQLSCIEGQPCSQLMAVSFETLCPKDSGTSGGTSGTSGGTSGTSGGGTKALGDACTCANAGAGSDGFCSGTDQQCMSNLKCIYGAGSNGAGHCYADSCCDMTSACEMDSSLLKACSVGTCKSTPVGFYCGN